MSIDLPPYRPAYNGIHVCGIRYGDGYGEAPETIWNLHLSNPSELFYKAKEQFEESDQEARDLLVDLMIDGDIHDDFPLSRQMLDKFKEWLLESAI